jgi:hypothetical protein
MFKFAPHKLDLNFDESVRGRKANCRGKLGRALAGTLSGGTRAKGEGDNRWIVEGVEVRFHGLTGGKKTFTLNPKSELDHIIVAYSKDKVTTDKPLDSELYGLKLEDCKRVGRVIESKTIPGRISVHITSVGTAVPLGFVYLPAKYTEAETVAEHDEMVKAIDSLSAEEMAPMMCEHTKGNIHEFLASLFC